MQIRGCKYKHVNTRVTYCTGESDWSLRLVIDRAQQLWWPICNWSGSVRGWRQHTWDIASTT